MLKEKVDLVRQLAGEKGFKYHTSNYSSEDYELLNILIRLTHIQKWLRDEHKIFVWIEPIRNSLLYVLRIKNQPDIKAMNNKSFEETLLEGIEKALTYI